MVFLVFNSVWRGLVVITFRPRKLIGLEMSIRIETYYIIKLFGFTSLTDRLNLVQLHHKYLLSSRLTKYKSMWSWCIPNHV